MFAVCGREVWQLESRKRGVVIRYWGCQLKCPLCFAQSYAYRGEATHRKRCELSLSYCLERFRAKVTRTTTWCRIEGGEPLQTRSHMAMTVKLAVEALKFMRSYSRAVIQTNGIWLGQSEENITEFCRRLEDGVLAVNDTSKRVAIEISFKGPNSQAARIYSGRADIDVLNTQINAFVGLVENVKTIWDRGNHCVSVYPVAGFGPDLERLTFIPLDPQDKSYPLFHPSTWDSDFKKKVIELFGKIVENYPDVYSKYKAKHGSRISLYGLEPTKWQKSWTSRIGKDPAVEKFVREYIRVNASQRSLNLFARDIGTIFDEIIASDELIAKAEEMRNFYAWPEPAEHYPSL